MNRTLLTFLSAVVSATLLTTTVRASAETSGIPFSIHVSETYSDFQEPENFDVSKNQPVETTDTFPTQNERVSIFLFSTVLINRSHTAEIWLIFSKATIASGSDCRIHSLFSDITLEGSSNAHFSSISSTINSAVPISVNAIFPMFSRTQTLGQAFTYSDKIPLFMIQFLISIFQILVVITIYLLKKSFIEQGSVLLIYEPLSVVKNGLKGYSVLLLLIIIFSIALVTIPVALLLLVLTYVVTLIGEAQFAVLLGHTIYEKLGKRADSFLCLFTGILVIESLKLLPYTGWLVSMIFLPIATVGCALTAFINGFYRKKFYELPFASSSI